MNGRGPAGPDGDGLRGRADDDPWGRLDGDEPTDPADGDGAGSEGPPGAGRGDPELAAALARTHADLAAAPAPALPPHVLARLDGALAAARDDSTRDDTPRDDTHPTSHLVRRAAPGTRTPRRPRRRPRRALLLAVAAVLVVLAAGVGTVGIVGGGAGVTGTPGTGPVPTAAPPGPGVLPPGGEVPRLAGDDVVTAWRGGVGRTDYGPLGAGDLRGCLDAHGVPAGVTPVGARRVVLDGAPGVLLVLPTGVAARFRVLVVGERCAAGVPDTLTERTVGR